MTQSTYIFAMLSKALTVFAFFPNCLLLCVYIDNGNKLVNQLFPSLYPLSVDQYTIYVWCMHALYVLCIYTIVNQRPLLLLVCVCEGGREPYISHSLTHKGVWVFSFSSPRCDQIQCLHWSPLCRLGAPYYYAWLHNTRSIQAFRNVPNHILPPTHPSPLAYM